MHLKRFLKKGSENEFRFIIGIILAALIVVAFASCVFNLLKGEDAAEKTFDALADRIEAVGNRTSGTSTLAFRENSAELIRIDPGEPWLFFDKGTNYVVTAYTDIGLDEFKLKNFDILGISDKPITMDYFLGKLKIKENFGAGGVFLYEKPLDCGDSACMVICKNPKLTIKSSPKDEKTMSVEGVTISSKLTRDIKCSSTKVRTFDNIEKFYRKPFYALSPGVDGEAYSRTKIYGAGWFEFTIASNFGFALETIPPGISTSVASENKIDTELDAYAYKSKLQITEFSDGSSFTNRILMSSDVIYPQAFKKGIIMCYQPPCLTPYEQFYSVWQDIIDSCLLYDNCASLKAKIDDLKIDDSGALKIKQTLSFSTPNVDAGKPPVMKLVISGIENSILTTKTYVLDANVRLFTDLYGEEADAQIREISFYKQECKQVGMFKENPTVTVIKIGTDEMQFKSISVVKPVTSADKPTMMFYVEDLHPDCKSAVI